MLKVKTVVIVETLLLILSVTGFFMWELDLLEGMFGCFSCPAGARCNFGSYVNCSEIGKSAFVLFGTLSIIYPILFIAKQSVRKKSG